MGSSIETFDGIRQALCKCGTGRCTHGTLIAATVFPTVEELQKELAEAKQTIETLNRELNGLRWNYSW